MTRPSRRRKWPWILIALGIIYVAIHFPYATDAPSTPAETAKTIAYYQQAYTAPPAADPNEDVYVKVAEQASKALRIKENLEEFVDAHQLRGRKALDVGAGQGYLQDVVDDYTGLDISPTAKRFFHKPFVMGSATAMPFPDNQFDVAWSIFVLEHIPTPEQALLEMRRVVKDGGIIYLFPAWTCTPWAADGHEVRPYSDFNVFGKLTKATIPLRTSNLYRASYTAPTRVMRFASYAVTGSPTRFHYTRIKPNYEKYWMPDSDAVNSMDRYEAMLWFVSRGDECMNCTTPFHDIRGKVTDGRLLIRVHKHQ